MVSIYTLSHPLTGEVRYVGKTAVSLHKRLTGHANPRPKDRSHRANWIRSLISKGLTPIMSLLEEVSKEDWVEREIYWIKKYKSEGCRLVNSTIGGDGGGLGYKHTEDAIRRMGQSRKGKPMHPNTRAAVNKANTGSKRTEESRRKMSSSRSKPVIVIMENDETLEFISAKHAAEFIAGTAGNVTRCCRNERKSYKGCRFYYKEDGRDRRIIDDSKTNK